MEPLHDMFEDENRKIELERERIFAGFREELYKDVVEREEDYSSSSDDEEEHWAENVWESPTALESTLNGSHWN